MSAAEVLTALVYAGAEVAEEAGGLRVRASGRLPQPLLAQARDAKPALLRVASGRWRLDLATWPLWRLDLYEERAAIREICGRQPRELAERCAFLEFVDAPEPTPDAADGEDDAPPVLATPLRPAPEPPRLAPTVDPRGDALSAIEADGLRALGGLPCAPVPLATVDPARAASWWGAYQRRVAAGLDPEDAARLTCTTHGPRPAA